MLARLSRSIAAPANLHEAVNLAGYSAAVPKLIGLCLCELQLASSKY